ncbi:MAG: hypothetical protein JSV35_04405 [Candidatus Bathyarchaeota archaeon]|nr:MAG: hypothetical protein JSV35_04405 [Candidatus Bathyarchaeota archaeon]
MTLVIIYDARHGALEALVLKNTPFAIKKAISGHNRSNNALGNSEIGQHTQFLGESVWLSRKMIDEGCSLEQTLHIMEARCKTCNTNSPLICIEQCGTWQVKRELKDIHHSLQRKNHEETLLNALKSRRRLGILHLLQQRGMKKRQLQKKLKSIGFSHSQEVISQYLEPLLLTRLVREDNDRFKLTLYGRKVIDSIREFSLQNQLRISSVKYDKKVIRYLLNGPASRSELLTIIPVNSLTRILKRLLKQRIIQKNSSPYRVFYFRTKRLLSTENLTPIQTRICNSIPVTGISAPDLSKSTGINLRRIYQLLRTLRGKKLVFRRNIVLKYTLTPEGKRTGHFLEEISRISSTYLDGLSNKASRTIEEKTSS